uniref:Zinc finger CCCH-type containing 7B n=1 Tax=Oryzias latipes TaxID=8090 RepID=A0A3P9IDV5_ORYLA
MDPSREKRKEDIMKLTLVCIHVYLLLFCPSKDYLTQLVCNLLEEGNAFFKDGLCDQAAREFTEGLNVSSYAESEEIQIPVALQESLFVNRAAAYHSMGKYDESIADCNMALEVCKESRRALYRKALCLKELGRYREAYDCTSECLLSCPEDKQGKELAQELTVLLGLKTRKPYVSTKVKELSKVYHLHPYFSMDALNLLLHISLQAAFSFPLRTSTSTHTLPPVLPAPTPQLPPAFFSSAISQLNSLDSFTNDEASYSAAALDILDDLGSSSGDSGSHYGQKKDENFNPLSSTHEFLQACSTCFPREGVGIYTFVHKPDLVHNCKRDVLLCRRKDGFSSEWTRVRRLPPKVSFSGPFVLCKDLGVCKYGENCTFAYNQLEIDVWTVERKGTLDRNLLFGAEDGKLDPVNSIICLLRENKGMFIFLCQECYDNKPRIISRRSSKKSTSCSNLDSPHNFSANKCLVFEVSKLNVNYNKVRPLSPLCHLDLCRPAIRYGCLREDDCLHAHSVIELKTWKIQRISCDEIVKISKEFYEKQEQHSNKNKGNRSLNMRMKFVCALCLRGGLTSEPDKTLKYCKSKARHAWTKDRRVLLVMSSERSKWVQVRPLPHTKNFPFYYDMCAQILEKRKCNYPGNCTFAHSQEEKEMWMYMKNNDLRDMQQVYDMWLALAAQNRQAEDAPSYHPNYEEKCIIMPTDYADQLSGFHCRLCGKHSNSQRQWQQHISSEKHKDRVFSCEGEDEALTWRYRFPGCICVVSRLDGGCSEGVSCDFAHSAEELQEWIERRDFLRQKLAKAREDMLVLPDELDFGKFNFLLQD